MNRASLSKSELCCNCIILQFKAKPIITTKIHHQLFMDKFFDFRKFNYDDYHQIDIRMYNVYVCTLKNTNAKCDD